MTLGDSNCHRPLGACASRYLRASAPQPAGRLQSRYSGGMAIAKFVQVRRMSDVDNSRQFWMTQPAADRFAAIEEIRAEVHGWTDETQPRLQRVCRVLRGT